jgi:FSR family fosmidomycin resistance protein-like MFS transporter
VWRLGPRDLRPQPGRPPLGAILRANRRMLAGLISVAATRSWATALLSSFLPIYAVSRGLAAVDAPQLLTVYLLSGALGGLIGGWLADRVGRDRVIIASMLLAAPFCVLLGLQEGVTPVFILATGVSGMLLNGSFVVLAVRGQESMPGSLGMVSGLMLGLSIGLGGIAVAPMGVLAEHLGIPIVLYVAAFLSLATALLMRAVPRPPARGEALAAMPAIG